MAGTLRLEHGSRTDIGCVRRINEDAYLADAEHGVWAVADGMGGHSAGDWASAQIVAALEGTPLPKGLEDASAMATRCLEQANAAIYLAGRRSQRVIGSTAAVLILRDRRFVALWAGDSRIYRVRDQRPALLTRDHSQVAEMVAAGHLSPEEAEDHPLGHLLSRAIGVRPELALDRNEGSALPGDTFLLCSDGLTRAVREREIAQVLSQQTPQRAATALVDLALAVGAADNVTVVVIGCDEATHVMQL